MTKKQVLLFWLLIGLLLTTATVLAETRYVVDNLIITMRSGQSTQHQVLRTWPSSTKLEILEAGEKYSRARGPDGTEGWVLNQYISLKPTAKIRLVTAESKLAKLETKNNRLNAELKTLGDKEAGVSEQHKKLARDNKKQNEELTRLRRVAAKPLKLENENQRLKRELLELESQHELLRQENQMLGDSSDREWFLNGAGVVILGIILGLIIPRLRVRKKSNWSSL